MGRMEAAPSSGVGILSNAEAGGDDLVADGGEGGGGWLGGDLDP
jgi:hypothetical protein